MTSKEIFYNRRANSNKFHKIQAKCIGEFQTDLLIWENPNKFTEAEKLDRHGQYNSLSSSKRTRSGEYILVVVDVFSRMADAKLIERKDADEVLSAYKSILRNQATFDGFIPYKVICDQGGEFKAEFKEYCEDVGTEVKLVYGDGTADKNVKLGTSIAERFNRTLRGLLNYRMKGDKGKNKLTQRTINDCLFSYNHSVSKSVNAKPYSVFWNGTIPKSVVRKYNIEGKNNKAKLKYSVGDHVRVMKQFQKMSKNSKREIVYSEKVYEIVQRDKNRYTLNTGDEYPYSRLLKTKSDVSQLRRRRRQVDDDDDSDDDE